MRFTWWKKSRSHSANPAGESGDNQLGSISANVVGGQSATPDPGEFGDNYHGQVTGSVIGGQHGTVNVHTAPKGKPFSLVRLISPS